jgi:hypothetical protein
VPGAPPHGMCPGSTGTSAAPVHRTMHATPSLSYGRPEIASGRPSRKTKAPLTLSGASRTSRVRHGTARTVASACATRASRVLAARRQMPRSLRRAPMSMESSSRTEAGLSVEAYLVSLAVLVVLGAVLVQLGTGRSAADRSPAESGQFAALAIGVAWIGISAFPLLLQVARRPSRQPARGSTRVEGHDRAAVCGVGCPSAKGHACRRRSRRSPGGAIAAIRARIAGITTATSFDRNPARQQRTRAIVR